MDSLPRWLRDFFDLNNEMAGRETGRVRRFSAPDDSNSPEAEKKKDEQRFNALLRLLQNPEYAQLYRNAVDTVTRAGEATQRAMQNLARESEIIAGRIEALKENAAEMPDGRKVFRSSDGRLMTEDGTDVTDQKDSIKGLSSSTSSWEDFQRSREIAADLEQRKRELEAYRRDVLDPARLRLGDTKKPPMPEELEEIIKRTKKMPRDAQEELMRMETQQSEKAPPINSAAAAEHDGPTKLGGPDLFGQFRAASAVISDDAFAPPTPAATAKPV